MGMLWFRHNADMHNNLKLQAILNNWKMVGYGVWIVCLEIVAGNSDPKKGSFSVKKNKNWRERLKTISGVSFPTLDKILQDLAENNLISKKALKIGSLSMPKMIDYLDEYSQRVRKEYRAKRDNIGIISGIQDNTDKTIHNKTNTPPDFSLINLLKEWNERQSSPIANFKPENIINKHGLEKIEALYNKFGKENNGFSLFLGALKDT